MKKAYTLFLFSCFTAIGFSQQYIGYHHDNYAGVQGLLLNPASVAGSKYKVNVNIVSLSFLGGNNAYELDKKKLFKFDFSGGMTEGVDFFKQDNTDNKNLWINADILGPSFMVTTGPKSGFGIYSRLRTLVNENNLSNSTFQFFNSDAGPFDVPIQEKDVHFKVHSFAEAAITYGRTVHSSNKKTIKIGLTGKYVVGVGAVALYSDELAVNVNAAKNFNQLDGNVFLQYSSNIDDLGNSNFFDVFSKRTGEAGWGIDAGVVVEWKSTEGTSWLQTDQTPYKVRLGLSLTDLGVVNYDNSTHGNNYVMNGTGRNTSEFEKQGSETYDDYFSRLRTAGILIMQDRKDKIKVKLPMAIRANVDWHVYKRIFINAGALVNMLNKDNRVSSANYVTSFSVTPRLEKKWFSIYTPVYYNMEGQFGWGAGFRAGPLFAGSASVLSNLVGKKNISGTDFHVGLSIPVFQHKSSTKVVEKIVEVIKEVPVDNDKDKDGVVNEKDKCPDEPGEVALEGCPDKDGDGVADKDDKCPDVAGSDKYNGCPIPDSDGDGLNDEEDLCPNLRGIFENKGCPEIKKEIVTKVNSAARRIYFVTNKAVLQKASFKTLDMVADLLKADPNLKLNIAGHTDNVGSDAVNNVLSVKRAQAVRDYLVRKGIGESRLIAEGFGSTRPVTSNKTATGRAKNRRVEMRLGYY